LLKWSCRWQLFFLLNFLRKTAENITIEGNRNDYADFQKMMGTPFDLLFNIVEP